MEQTTALENKTESLSLKKSGFSALVVNNNDIVVLVKGNTKKELKLKLAVLDNIREILYIFKGYPIEFKTVQQIDF